MLPNDSGHGDTSTDRSVQSTNPTVLLADDDDAFRETLVIWLSTDDRWAVREARNGEAAVRKLDETVDVLVLDRRMPKLSGPEVLDRLDDRGFDGAVVVLSAFEPDSHLTDTETAAYLTKPIDRETLVETLVDAAERAGASVSDADDSPAHGD